MLVVVGLQLAALALLPFRSARARLFGREITLRTAPVDPFDLLAGRHVVLRYAVEAAGTAVGQGFEEGQTVWIVVAEGQPAWELVAVAPLPAPPTPGHTSLRATWHLGRPSLEGAGRLYLPEADALEADELVRRSPGDGLVDLVVDEHGNASPRRLRLGTRVFGAPE